MAYWLPWVTWILVGASLALSALSARRGSGPLALSAGGCFAAAACGALMLDWPWELLLLCALLALTCARVPRKERRSEL